MLRNVYRIDNRIKFFVPFEFSDLDDSLDSPRVKGEHALLDRKQKRLDGKRLDGRRLDGRRLDGRRLGARGKRLNELQ